jgi:carboxyl-terminal processing protease
MAEYNKKIILRVLIIGLLALIGTNLATYYLASGQTGQPEKDGPTVIKYEPARRDPDTELMVVQEALNTITEYYFSPVEKEVLVEGALRGMIDSIGDPQVRFFDPEELEEFMTDTEGSYSGIGVRIVESNGRIVVFEVFPDSPAQQSGLTPGDFLLEADGNELTNQGVSRAVELLRGPARVPVVMLIKRPGADEPIKLSVDRAEIKVTTVFSEMLNDGLGYIRISSFDSGTAGEFSSQFREMERRGLGVGLILDLRNNPGGLVDQAVEIAKQLVPEGEIVRLVGRDGEVKNTYYSSAAKKPYPIVVLINEDSASSAELLAGALQDRGTALLVGKTTYGKASVQQLANLTGGSGILLTIARYFTPSGHDIHEHGIEPDFEVEMPEILLYYNYFFPDSLEQGDYGFEVEMLQLMLDQIGFPVEASGYFDLSTSIALTNFQIASSLPGSGKFDDLTWVELREALDLAARDNDEQLNYALELIRKPGFWTITGGRD